MKTLSEIILKIFGWKTTDKYPDLKKSVVVMAPHTSNWDLMLGKLYMNVKGVRGSVLVKKELFFFPLNLIMRAWGTIPVSRNDKKNNAILQVTSFFENNEKFTLVISAEGTRKKVTRWKKGFYYIAKRANVPIVVSYVDYKKKEVGIKGVIWDIGDIKETMIEINNMYKNINAKYPQNFSLDKRYS